MLHVKGLVKRYARLTALAGLDLSVDAGEVVGLIGHNGAGKSTLVHVVTGRVRADSGIVRVGRFDALREGRAARRMMGVTPQELALYPNLSVREHLRLSAALGGFSGSRQRRAVEDVAEELQLAPVLDRATELLSGGQKRRTQAAAALICRAPLLLLDEPTVGADPETRQALLEAVRARARDGAAVLYTTHYFPELAELEATIAVLSRGQVIARGTQAELTKGLPGEIRIRFSPGDVWPIPEQLNGRTAVVDGEIRVVSIEPARDLVALFAGGHVPVAVDVRPASLDDLYRALAEQQVA